MSYKVKSLVYLICFIVSVLIYGNMETSVNNQNPEDVQLVQTQTENTQSESDKPL